MFCRMYPVEIVEVNCDRSGHRLIGTGEDGLAYLIKRHRNSQLIPASEMICGCLAIACGLPAPLGCVARLPDGDLAFASRWEGGTLSESDGHVLMATPGALSTSMLSAIFAFDLFVANPDRHSSNFLLRRDSRHLDAVSILAFDFCQAFLVAGWPLPHLKSHCNTRVVARILHDLHGFDLGSALRILERLFCLPDDILRYTIDRMPVFWLPDDWPDRIMIWWRYDRRSRIEEVAHIVNAIHIKSVLPPP